MTSEPGQAPRGGSPFRGPHDAALRKQWQRERRAAVRTHHPDRGGTTHEMQRRLDAIDAAYQRLGDAPARRADGGWVGASATVAPAPGVTRRAMRRTQHHLRQLARAGRARIPKGWPGRRRYFDL
ncbi:hypothetical protein [Nocardioides hwasunensis]|uniref:J domain-containing protein n=1 Tax=Nocardioides hwasunensis TaxID=397258 RepID=A0ABR8M9Y9_9ACTN|nr:hypothetical protein [Nocardioides hwasunensis]MBD3912988.1 hypothetical protein [Nocardioides hwasunensis]